MRYCPRTDEPELLGRYGVEIRDAFVARRGRWDWPQRDGQDLLHAVRDALRVMTDGHCSFCDNHQLTESGQEQAEHFRPKSRFPELVCTWSNLFLSCVACNHGKRERWDEDLLKPDDETYRFAYYFTIDRESGRLSPNRERSEHDQRRAATTIDVFDLNREARCRGRRKTLERIQHGNPEERATLPYRFLVEYFDELEPFFV